MREHDRADHAQHHQRKILRWPELERQLGHRQREGGEQQRADAAGEERAERGDAECRTRAALARHLVTVETGHRRRRLPGQVDQDRRRRTAVLRAVVDAGEHDQRRDRRHAVRDRKQHGDRRHRADPRQHADQRAEKTADQRIEQVDRRDCDAESEREIRYQVHG